MARKSRKAVNQVILPAAPSEKIYRAGLYARISVETERKREADTIGNQIQLLKDFASENLDIDVVDIYVDDDISGTDFVRPEFSRMDRSVRRSRDTRSPAPCSGTPVPSGSRQSRASVLFPYCGFGA